MANHEDLRLVPGVEKGRSRRGGKVKDKFILSTQDQQVVLANLVGKEHPRAARLARALSGVVGGRSAE